MRKLWLVLLVACAAGTVSAANLTEVSFGDTLGAERSQRAVNLFEVKELKHNRTFTEAFDTNRFERTDSLLESQLVEDGGDVSSEQLFGAGVALGMASNPIGIGVTGWFDFYILRFLAVGAQFQLGYGIITDKYENGGDAVFVGLSIGAKFVMDFPDIEINRWWRPFVALYPAGFLYYSGTEEVEPPGTGNTKDFTYSDIFYHVYGGIGSDFFLTPNIAIGVALYVSGTIGGSKHKKHDVTIDTEGGVQVFFEYARLAIRF